MGRSKLVRRIVMDPPGQVMISWTKIHSCVRLSICNDRPIDFLTLRNFTTLMISKI